MWRFVVIAVLLSVSPALGQLDDGAEKTLAAKRCRVAAAEAVGRMGSTVRTVSAKAIDKGGLGGEYVVRVEFTAPGGERGLYSLLCKAPEIAGLPSLTAITLME